MYQAVSAVPPAFQTAACTSGRSVPRSPCLANAVMLYSPDSTPDWRPPPAMPHGPNVGARPGALQGLYRVQSSLEPATAWRLAVRCLGSLLVELMQCPGQRQEPTPCMLPSPGRPPLPSQLSQPMVQPDANQKQDWPTSHGDVPFEQEQPSWQLHGTVPHVSFGRPQRPVPGKSGTFG